MNLIFFKNQEEFREWLMLNHATETELWVGYYKKGTGKPGMTWSESVDQALCFGWIDGVRYKVDEEGYRIRFTPRKKTSRWSAINIAKVHELKRLGLMMPAGLEAFSHCRELEISSNSPEVSDRELPEEYLDLFKTNEKALDFFLSQPPAYKKMVVRWILSAKQQKTQWARLNKLISASAGNKRLY